MHGESFSVGDLHVQGPQSSRRVRDGDTPSRKKSDGLQHLFDCGGPDGISLQVVLSVWDNGERDVSAQDVSGPRALLILNTGRLRLSYSAIDTGPYAAAGRCCCTLKQARVDLDSSNHWSNLFKASEQELDEGAGTDVRRDLTELGAIAFGDRESVILDTGRHRGYQCVIFDEDNWEVPVAAFLLTRVLPLVNMYSAP